MQKVTKAVFPVAGFGTRFLPATKAMPKELMPIIDKPLIQYAVEEAIEAGIKTLIFITGRNKRAIEDHFDRMPELEAALLNKGKVDEANMVANILPADVDCVFIRQSEQLGLGHAISCSRSVIGDDAFAVLLADDFIAPKHGVNNTKSLVDAYEKSGKSQLSGMTIDDETVSQYGVIKPEPESNNVLGLVEKPTVSEAPSNVVSIGRYVLSAEIFNILERTPPGTGGEIQLADAINEIAQLGKVEFRYLVGERFDCGSKTGYLDAIMHVAGTHCKNNS